MFTKPEKFVKKKRIYSYKSEVIRRGTYIMEGLYIQLKSQDESGIFKVIPSYPNSTCCGAIKLQAHILQASEIKKCIIIYNRQQQSCKHFLLVYILQTCAIAHNDVKEHNCVLRHLIIVAQNYIKTTKIAQCQLSHLLDIKEYSNDKNNIPV